MTATTINAFYIGTLPILDTVQGSNGVMEGAATLLGHYAVGTDAVYHDLTVQHDPAVVDGLLATNDYGAGDANYPDGYYNEGFSNTPSGGFSELDSQQLFLGTVTYRDIDGTIKTIENVPFNVYQLENGDTFIAPTTEITSPTSGLYSDAGQFSASVLSGRDILSVDLNTMSDAAIGHDNLLYDYESVQDEVQTFYLGNHSILDTTQGNGEMEQAGTLLGSYEAASTVTRDGQFTLHTLNVHHDPAVNDELLATNDYGYSDAYYPDGYYDEGFSNTVSAGQNATTFSELDSQQLYWADVYYIDANGVEQVLHNVGIDVYQLENGDVYAVPTREIVSGDGTYADAYDTTPSVLAGLTISRIELTSLRNDAIGHDSLLYDSESIGDGTSVATLGLQPDGTVTGTEGNDSMGVGYSDAEGDIIDGADGLDDTIDAGLGNDTVAAGLGDDTLSGDAGTDSLSGGDGNDVIDGGADDDLLGGDAGNDTLIGGAGTDTLEGGDGADTFVVEGADAVVDFDTTTGIGDGDDSNNDLVDLSAYYNETTLAEWNAAHPNETYANPLSWLRADQADGVLDAAGRVQLYAPDGQPVSGAELTAENTRVVCFTRGTLIATLRGEVPVEKLTTKDRILTMDNGYKPLKWISSRKLSPDLFLLFQDLRPIQISAGALGGGLPIRDLIVSPQHRVLVRSDIAERMFGSREVLVAAKQLLDMPGIDVIAGKQEVEYWHFMFDQHEVVFAEGAPSESLYAGVEALKSLSAKSRAELLTIFPELAHAHAEPPVPARPLIRGAQGRRMAQRHAQNMKALIQS